MPHLEEDTLCPVTGKAMERRRPSSSPPAVATSSAPPRPRVDSTPPGEVTRWPSAWSIPLPPAPLPAGDSLDEGAMLRTEDEAASEDTAGPSAGGIHGLGPGELVGGIYRIKGVIGRGATAVVFEGEHEVLGRPVALKIMTNERVLSREARQRFLQEARAAASLSHAHICAVYDLGSLPDGALFCAQEFLRGEPLSARLEREGVLPLLDSVDLVGQLLLGLGAAHRKGIVHRDIKPENLFLAQVPGVAKPVVKILDFGLAKLVPIDSDDREDITEITRTGVVVGTPYYMAPEAVTGERDIDARADLWAAGVVLYQCVTGRVPFRGPVWSDTAQAILRSPPKPLASLRAGLPDGLQQVLDRALRKPRAERYPSTVEFLADLARLRPELPR